MDDHQHGIDGHVLVVDQPDSEAEVVEVAVTASADVEIEKIRADKEVAIARIAARAEEAHDETEVEILRGEIRAMKETLALLVPQPDPEPEPEPIVIPEPVDAAPDPTDLPPAEDQPHHRQQHKVGLGMWQ
jgi:hypothetical protein